MVPYDDLPGWVTEHEWKLATLLAREGEGYQSSEGLYEWMADTGDDPEGDPDRAVEARDATFAYMLGATADPPDEYFETAHPGSAQSAASSRRARLPSTSARSTIRSTSSARPGLECRWSKR